MAIATPSKVFRHKAIICDTFADECHLDDFGLPMKGRWSQPVIATYEDPGGMMIIVRAKAFSITDDNVIICEKSDDIVITKRQMNMVRSDIEQQRISEEAFFNAVLSLRKNIRTRMGMPDFIPQKPDSQDSENDIITVKPRRIIRD